jgi:uncharacterized protein (TIGR02246 family)
MKKTITILLLMFLAAPAFAADGSKEMKLNSAIRDTFTSFFDSWNKHDVKGMVTHWAGNASLINPMGRQAKGKDEITALMTDEQSTIFKQSTAKLVSIDAKWIGDGFAWYDAEMTVDNAIGQDGAAMPQMKIHVAGLMKKKGGKWLVYAARPYVFLPPPPKK